MLICQCFCRRLLLSSLTWTHRTSRWKGKTCRNAAPGSIMWVSICSVIEGFTKQTKIAGACLHVCIHIQTQIDGYRHSRMYTHTHAYTHIHVHKQKLAANKFYQEYTYRWKPHSCNTVHWCQNGKKTDGKSDEDKGRRTGDSSRTRGRSLPVPQCDIFTKR